MEKGISDLSVRLTASLRRSGIQNPLEENNVRDVEGGNGNEGRNEKKKTGVKKKRTRRVTVNGRPKDIDEEAGADRTKNPNRRKSTSANVGASHPKGRKRRPTLNQLVS